MYKETLAEILERISEPIRGGEYEAKQHLRQQGYKVKDVSDNPAYWDKDIDLLVFLPDKEPIAIEVKWDNVLHQTNNLFIETISNIEKNKDGWYQFCQANQLWYGDSVNQCFYIFDFQSLKTHIEAHKAEYKVVIANDKNKESQGYLVPLDTVKHLYYIQEV